MRDSLQAQQPADRDALKLRMVSEKVASATLWEIPSLLMRAPAYAQLPLEKLQSILLPAFENRQYKLVHLHSTQDDRLAPVSVVMWASVSDEIDAAIRVTRGQGFQLDKAQRLSGPHHWLTDMIGDETAVRAAVTKLKAEISPRGPISMFVRDASGACHVAEA